MELAVLAAFNRCATFELKEGVGLEADAAFEIWLNGQMIRQESRTVFSLYGLTPNAVYDLSLKRGEQSVSVSFSTLPESVLLDVTLFGAIGDGVFDCTPHLQAALLACPPQGTVYVPKGVYRTGPLFLKSDISLWLDEGATLLAETDRQRYPVLPGMTETTDERGEYNLGTWEGDPLDCFASLLTGVDLHRVDLYGQGVLDGNAAQGDWWRDVHHKRIAWRPFMLYLNRCRDVRVQGLRFQNACSWTIHPYYSDRLLFCDLTVMNHDQSPNSDGIDPESCWEVGIVGCDLSSGDDCIAIKSGKYYMSVRHLRETKGVAVRHCVMRRGHGAVVIGSETSGGVREVSVTQCRFLETDRGLRIKTRRGRGGKAVVDDVCMDRVEMDGVKVPFAVNMFYFCDPDGHSEWVQSREKRPMDDRVTPRVGTVTVRNTVCREAQAAGGYFFGLPEQPIEAILLQNVRVSFAAVPKPERPLMMDGLEPVAGLGLCAHHVKRLVLDNFRVEGGNGQTPELDDVEQVENRRAEP